MLKLQVACHNKSDAGFKTAFLRKLEKGTYRTLKDLLDSEEGVTANHFTNAGNACLQLPAPDVSFQHHGRPRYHHGEVTGIQVAEVTCRLVRATLQHASRKILLSTGPWCKLQATSAFNGLVLATSWHLQAATSSDQHSESGFRGH